ncbi:MAG: LytR/AlgR family response regulator transcription factor [Erysipelotrichaceae bacterium]
MIKIGLCEDNALYIRQFTTIIERMEQTNEASIELKVFGAGVELLAFCKAYPTYFDVLFLDIIMDGLNGIETAQALRNAGFEEDIIFLTSSKDYAFESYSVKAQGYLLKSQMQTGLEKCVNTIITKTKSTKKNTLFVKNNQDLYSLRLDHVAYFESNLRKISAHMSNGEVITFYNKLSDLEEQVGPLPFVRCHRSYLVNLLYVKNVVGMDVITTTHKTLPISKKYINSTKQAFTDFIKHQLVQP